MRSGFRRVLLGDDWTSRAGNRAEAATDRAGGYGFISTDDGDLDDDEDVFFHMEDVGGEDLTEGTEVEFDIESSPKGPRASNVVRQ